MPAKILDPRQEYLLKEVRDIARDNAAERASIEATIRAQVEKDLYARDRKLSEAMNAARSSGVPRSRIVEAIGIRNWYTVKNLFEMTASAVEEEKVNDVYRDEEGILSYDYGTKIFSGFMDKWYPKHRNPALRRGTGTAEWRWDDPENDIVGFEHISANGPDNGIDFMRWAKEEFKKRGFPEQPEIDMLKWQYNYMTNQYERMNNAASSEGV